MIRTDGLGTITLGKQINHGGDGAIIEVIGHDEWLVKKYDPHPPPTDRQLQQKRTVYKLFASLKFRHVQELHCLPAEYIEWPDGTPGYLMKRAEGRVLSRKSISDSLKLSLDDRLRIARSFAKAMDFLHSSQVVHADIWPNNFFITGGPGQYKIQILDIDSGGYFGPIRQFPPSVPVARRLYGSPELVHSTWSDIWANPLWRKQPDLWALAVLFYQILVDDEGPFSSNPSRPSVPGYRPYGPRDSFGGEPWPRPWQVALMHQRNIDPIIIRNFEIVFGGNRRIDNGGDLRTTAKEWISRLDIVLGVRRPAVSRLPPGKPLVPPPGAKAVPPGGQPSPQGPSNPMPVAMLGAQPSPSSIPSPVPLFPPPSVMSPASKAITLPPGNPQIVRRKKRPLSLFAGSVGVMVVGTVVIGTIVALLVTYQAMVIPSRPTLATEVLSPSPVTDTVPPSAINDTVVPPTATDIVLTPRATDDTRSTDMPWKTTVEANRSFRCIATLPIENHLVKIELYKGGECLAAVGFFVDLPEGVTQGGTSLGTCSDQVSFLSGDGGEAVIRIETGFRANYLFTSNYDLHLDCQ